MTDTVKIATANTYYGQMLLHGEGLKPFIDDHTDILLLQELWGLELPDIERYLKTGGYRVINAQIEAGLVIALRIDSGLAVVEESESYQPLVKHKPLRKHRQLVARKMRLRGLLSVQLKTTQGQTFIVSTTHTSVFILRRSRTKQLLAIETLLRGSHHSNQPLIIGADMNHYPRAGKYDLWLHNSAQLKLAAIADPTWRIQGSKHEWMGKIGSFVTRRPIESFDAQLDALLYRGDGLTLADVRVIDIESDHRAIVGNFTLI